MKYYLSGKMTGLKEEEIWKNFQRAENIVIDNWRDDYGCMSVMNPAVTYAMRKFDAFSYEDWLKIDFAMLDACDAVVLLPNWEDSMGAKREIMHAWETKKVVYFPSEILGKRFGYKFTDGKKYNWSVDEKRLEEVVIEIKKHDLLKKIEVARDAALTEAARQEVESLKERIYGSR